MTKGDRAMKKAFAVVLVMALAVPLALGATLDFFTVKLQLGSVAGDLNTSSKRYDSSDALMTTADNKLAGIPATYADLSSTLAAADMTNAAWKAADAELDLMIAERAVLKRKTAAVRAVFLAIETSTADNVTDVNAGTKRSAVIDKFFDALSDHGLAATEAALDGIP